LAPNKLIRKLDEGVMGEVYLAEDDRLDRRITLKMLLGHFTQDQDEFAVLCVKQNLPLPSIIQTSLLSLRFIFSALVPRRD
jgi:hypothetical protein